ncbi:hypothetical protein I4F81_003296 [Pyropia yezoensis]|uniref:Uncharacterized protein n=1 Tax=Pyropia yezoensis TaxID=2788 RepID=A0ACC3BS01_PYRYE|nr:hypothetical protein I4F81_003296 [Neopyropia yezoensis]
MGVNTARGESQERALLTGRFALAEVPCAACGSVVGWNYVAAADERQAYKAGTTILEAPRIRQ